MGNKIEKDDENGLSDSVTQCSKEMEKKNEKILVKLEFFCF